MKYFLFFLWMGGFLFLVGCQTGLFPEESGEEATLKPMPTEILPAVSLGDAGQTALTFFKSWEAGDYAGMYSLLSPQSQTLVALDTFSQRYLDTLTTIHVQSIHTQPLFSRQEGTEAEFGVRVTWKTPVLGDIVRQQNVKLVYGQERWGIVWDEGLILPELAGGNRLVLELHVPARGNIYDRDGLALAYQGTSITLGVVPGQIVDEAGLLTVVAPLLGQTPEEVKAIYADALPDWYVPLGDVSGEVIQTNLPALQPYLNAGLTTNNRLSRLYSEEGVAAHLIGYVGSIPADQLTDYQLLGYQIDDKVGLAGLENWGETYLAGTRGGTLRLIGPTGEDLGIVQESEPRQARSLYTTLQRDFQLGVEKALADAIHTYPLGKAGAIVVLNPQTGAVLAMASYPTYNPSVFDATRANAGAELGLLLNDSNFPLLNRALQGAYPLGSVFKLVTISAGLNSGQYNFTSRFTSVGTWNRLGDAYIKRDWREGGHGNVSYRDAIVVSCNTCFYDMGYELDAIDSYLLPNIAKQFGLGSVTGIVGVPAFTESPGLIPDPDWKLASFTEGWARGDAVNMAIGQGFVLVTPLQTANFVAAIANGGTLYQPTLIDRLGAGGGSPEEKIPTQIIGQLPLSPEQLAGLQEALRAVTTAGYGTATDKFVGLSVPVAGKTGTAEAPPYTSHAWFAGYAPATPYTRPDGTTINQPEIAIAVLMENAGEGSAVSAPIFRRVVELYYGITPLTPYPWGG